ncbi:MAG: 30S ribosomal protein S13 [Actinobacteria bacterium]|nr:30S ribosomal protein S13 [Actinomycetota bacterium]
MAFINLSDDSRKKGLEKARLIRKRRSEIKEQLKKGKISIDKLFKDRELFENYIAGMKVLNIVSSLPGNGRMNAVRILEDLRINPHKKIGGLGKNQKENFYKYFNIT